MPRYTYATPTFITEAFCLVSYICTTALKVKVMIYTALAYSYLVCFYNTLQFSAIIAKAVQLV